MIVKANYEIRKGQSIVWKGYKFNLKDHDKMNEALTQFKFAWDDYSDKFKDIDGYLSFSDDKGLCEIFIK